jgi:hypothetical protein
MFTLDHRLAQNAFAERLREAEQERFAQRFLANQPNLLARLQGKLGDLLITLGTTLKAQLPPDLAEAR